MKTYQKTVICKAFLFCSLILTGAMVKPVLAYDWDPPPKKVNPGGLSSKSGNIEPIGWKIPNLEGKFFFRIDEKDKRLFVMPYDQYLYPHFKPRIFKRRRKILEQYKDNPKYLLNSMSTNGYGINYVKIPRQKENIIVPLLGHLFYVPADPKADEKTVRCSDFFRLDSLHSAYKALNFKEKGVYSFPINESIAEWYADPNRNKQEFPRDTAHMLHAHEIIVRKIEMRKDKSGKSVPMAEMAIYPWMEEDPKESDFRWHSVGDELPIPWAFEKFSEKPGRRFELGKTMFLEYFKIVNIVPRDSQTIKVQPEGGGPPLECKPIGWVDLDIHGREPEKDKPKP